MKWLVVVASLAVLVGCSSGQDRNSPLARPENMRVIDAAITNGLPQTALALTRRMLQGDPRSVDALLRQGDALMAMGQPDAAEECYRRVLEVQAQSADALRGLGRARLAMGQAKEAETAFRKAIEHAPDAATLNNLGIALDLQDRHDEAQAAYQAALTRRPSMTAAQVNLGLSLALAGATDRALAILQPLANDPTANGRIRQDLAVALALAGDEAQARKVLSGELPQDGIATALAGYAALKLSAK